MGASPMPREQSSGALPLPRRPDQRGATTKPLPSFTAVLLCSRRSRFSVSLSYRPAPATAGLTAPSMATY